MPSGVVILNPEMIGNIYNKGRFCSESLDSVLYHLASRQRDLTNSRQRPTRPMEQWEKFGISYKR